ncbi:MAG: lipopolysaccharide heptosyltransferase II [Magnetococcales bacterium]|nr:lipopolysaccharide heptosyltransferase II [Magnetococcales bacterium]
MAEKSDSQEHNSQPLENSDNSAILVVGPSWVGDMVMAQTLFKLLKERQPKTPIDVLAPAWSSQLLERMPEVRKSIANPLGHGQLGIFARFKLGRSLVGRYKQAIVLPNSLKSALIPFHAKIPLRTGFIGEMRWGFLNDARPLDKKRLPKTTDRFIALGLGRDEAMPENPPTPSFTSLPKQAKKLLQRLEVPDNGQPYLVLCPGAEYGEAKQWPRHHYSTVAKIQAREGWNILIVGSAKEKELCQNIAKHAGNNGYDLSGRTTLAEMVDILSIADGVICNDSGPMHVAAALGVPVIAIYGSSDPNHTPPVGPKAHAISLNLQCAPCFKRECPEKHLRCLEEISPTVVLQKLASIRQ